MIGITNQKTGASNNFVMNKKLQNLTNSKPSTNNISALTPLDSGNHTMINNKH